ncbi:MAG TPA: DUF3105 domain-containing protein [Candidatus Limnocylindria bacterium]|nr:DUF3105 domain-containing protein [Candidatus Limnocylindria bacterium]
MARRRTAGIQRRSRASDEALARRVGESGARPIDGRLLAIGGILVVGLVVLLAVFLFGNSGVSNRVGQPQINDGQAHVAVGAPAGPYSSVPATSGQHWDSPANWGVYTAAGPAIEQQVIHNLEHGGIVVWYQADQLDAAGIEALDNWARQQIATARFKVILSPWLGQDFGHAVAATSWTWLLYLDDADLDQLRAFLDDHYQQDAPEPFGGPGQPTG